MMRPRSWPAGSPGCNSSWPCASATFCIRMCRCRTGPHGPKRPRRTHRPQSRTSATGEFGNSLYNNTTPLAGCWSPSVSWCRRTKESPQNCTATPAAALKEPSMSTESAGTVTFLFTDIEGSTRLLRQLGDRRYSEILAEHRKILRTAITASAGQEVDTEGDGFFVAFYAAKDAVRAALTAQEALQAHAWPAGAALRVRMGLHTGVPVAAESGYVGVGVHRASRISQAGHGGQVLLSQTTADMVEGDLPNGVRLRALGEYRLKDMPHRERIFQLVAPGLHVTFPAIRALSMRSSRLYAVGLVAVLMIATAFVLVRTNVVAPRGGINSMAVLPLENLRGDPAQEYLADGMTEALISTLGQVGALRVISRTSVMQYKGTKKSVPQIARELGVDGIIEGSVLRSGNHIRVTAQLINGARDRHVWGNSYLTPEQATRLAAARPVDPEAHETYLRGLYELNKPRTKQHLLAGISQFKRAVERDPQHALAWAEMSYAYVLLSLGEDPSTPPKEHWANAKAAGLMAVKSDPTLAETHAALANAVASFGEWAAAEEGFRKALELNPNSAQVNVWYSELLFIRGRMPEAVQQVRRAQELDPLNINTSAWTANVLFFARRYDEAVDQVQKVLEIEPKFGWAHSILGRILIEKGMHREGVAALRKAEELGFVHPWHLGMIGRAYVLTGNKVEAQKMLTRLKQEAKKNPFADTPQSMIYAALGEKAEAIAALERGFKRGDDMAVLKTAPWWDALRSDPRYKVLERAVYGN